MILDSNYFATNGLWFIIIPMLLCDSNFLIFPPHSPFVFCASRFILFMDADYCCYSHSSSLVSTSNEIATSLSSHHFVLAAAAAFFFGFLMKVVELSTYMWTKKRAEHAGKIIAWLSSYTFFGYTGRARVSSFWPSKRFTLELSFSRDYYIWYENRFSYNLRYRRLSAMPRHEKFPCTYAIET